MLSETEDRTLIERAMKGDHVASVELIRRQREGRSLRLYSQPRKGPNDEGIVPFVFAINGPRIELHVGRADQAITLRKGEVADTINAIVKLGKKIVDQTDGDSTDEIADQLHVPGTEGFDVKCIATDDGVSFWVYPLGLVAWCMNVRDIRLFMSRVLDCAKSKGWSYDDMGFSRQEAATVRNIIEA